MSRGVVAGAALVAGGLAFAVIWVTSASDLNFPWIVSLGVHGTSIVLVGAGLLLTASRVDRPPWGRRLIVFGAWATVGGLLTVLPLIPVGLGIFGAGLIIARRSPAGGVALAAGATILLATYVLGARVGFEDAPPLSAGLRLAFQAGALLVLLGLSLLGTGDIRRARMSVRSASGA